MGRLGNVCASERVLEWSVGRAGGEAIGERIERELSAYVLLMELHCIRA